MTPEGLAALLAAALPGEELTAAELAATLFEDPDGAVLADPGGRGAIGVATRGATGFVTIIAVEPAAQRQGTGSALLEQAHDWLRARRATRAVTGASAPRYLWPGVDVDRHAAAVAFFAAAGYEVVGEARNHRCPTSYRAPVPAGVELRRVRAGTADAGAVLAFAARAYPQWSDEVSRSLPSGCCHAAFTAGGHAVGFGCHTVNRAGWIGPMATDPAHQGQGIGAALLGAVCRDLELADMAEAEIAWVGPDGFYERTAGSAVSRRFAVMAAAL